ncbi:hypothetical protein ABZP36_026797 [Zizania latifolia]
MQQTRLHESSQKEGENSEIAKPKDWRCFGASDLQGEKGCDITEMPQTQITHYISRLLICVTSQNEHTLRNASHQSQKPNTICEERKTKNTGGTEEAHRISCEEQRKREHGRNRRIK